MASGKIQSYGALSPWHLSPLAAVWSLPTSVIMEKHIPEIREREFLRPIGELLAQILARTDRFRDVRVKAVDAGGPVDWISIQAVHVPTVDKINLTLSMSKLEEPDDDKE
jgi:hypothetical protein